jgi:ABC-type transport system involved in multi-copper enzyme maturation permease subunit
LVALFAVEFFKLRHRLMTWVLFTILLAIIILLYVVLWAVTEEASEIFVEPGELQRLRRFLFLREAVPFGLQLVSTFGLVLAVILAAGAMGSEYGWGTIRVMLSSTPGRINFLTAKMAAVMAMVMLGSLVGMLTAIASSTIIAEVGGGADFSFVDRGYIARSALSFGRTILVVTPYVMMAFFFTVWGRSTMAGVAAGIGVGFLEGIITGLMRVAGSPWDAVPQFFLDANADVLRLESGLSEGLGFGPQTRPALSEGLPDPSIAALTLGLWTLLFLALSIALFRRRDVTG